jgi:hypothetical protein
VNKNENLLSIMVVLVKLCHHANILLGTAALQILIFSANQMISIPEWQWFYQETSWGLLEESTRIVANINDEEEKQGLKR